jgi:DNA polymerase-3 subunit delta
MGKSGKPTRRRSSGETADSRSPRRSVIAVYGPDDFLRRQAIEGIEAAVLGHPAPPMSLIDFNGLTAELAEVLDEVRTLPFLAGVRLVIVHDADAFITRHREALERYAQAPSPTGVLVLVCKVMNKQWRLTKAIEKVGELIECKAPPPWKRGEWVRGRAREAYGKTIGSSAAEALVELAGEDMASLDSELSKLAIYVGDRTTISATDVEDLVGLTRPENVFRITDAIAQGDAATAMSLWRQTLATDSQAAFRAVGGLAWAVRQAIAAKTGASAAGGRRGALVASRFTLEQLHDMLVELLMADVASKTGVGTIQSAIERFIVRQCQVRR